MMRIERGVPLDRKRGREAVYPFSDMDVGDSFLVGVSGDARAVQRRVASAASAAGKRLGYRFVTRQVNEGGEVSVRCWRVL